MGMLESIVRWRFVGMSSDERVGMMERLMPIIFENIDSQDLRNMAELLLPALIEQFVKALESDDLTKMAAKVVPQMVSQAVEGLSNDQVFSLLSAIFPDLVRICSNKLDSCYIGPALTICREALDKVENIESGAGKGAEAATGHDEASQSESELYS